MIPLDSPVGQKLTKEQGYQEPPKSEPPKPRVLTPEEIEARKVANAKAIRQGWLFLFVLVCFAAVLLWIASLADQKRVMLPF